MTLFLLPLILAAIYLAMYLMRTGRTRDCRWRIRRRDAEGVHWHCLACGGSAVTFGKDPAFCARGGPVPGG